MRDFSEWKEPMNWEACARARLSRDPDLAPHMERMLRPPKLVRPQFHWWWLATAPKENLMQSYGLHPTD